MSNRTRNFILFLTVVMIGSIIALFLLPNVVQAIPGRYRVALQERVPLASTVLEGVIDEVAPMPAALPVAAAHDEEAHVDIKSLIETEPPSEIITLPSATTVPPTSVTVTAEAETAAVSLSEAADAGEPADVAEAAVVPTATTAPTETPVPAPVVLPGAHTLAGMGVIRQTFNNCGPANLTQVLNWYGSDIGQEEIASFLKPNHEDRNVSPWQIADYVNEQTGGRYRASAHSGGDLELLRTLLSHDFPVVIEKGYALPESGWWGHYLTVYAYDDEAAEFLTQDSYLGPWDGSGRSSSYEEVEAFWPQFNNTFYVVYTPDREAELFAILGPDMLDEATMWRNVAANAEKIADQNPDDAFAWFNLGTSLTRLGELSGEAQYYQGGAQAFDTAREIGLPPRMLWYQHRPYIAYDKVGRYQDVIDLANSTLETQGGRNVEETYWYKGHALAALGDLFAAQAAYQSALGVNENFYPARISLDWVNSVLNEG